MQYNHELDRYPITSREALYNCVYGGKGYICLVAPTMKAHSYRFNKPRNKDDFPDDVIFVSVLHERSYFYIGMIENGKFRRTKNSRFEEDNESVKGARYILKLLDDPGLFHKTAMRMYHHGKCAVCGRKLTSGKYISLGVGPKCKNKVIQSAKQPKTV